MGTGATLGRGNARRDHPRLEALPGHRPIVAGSILQEIRRLPPVKNLLRYVCIDLYNLYNR
jgi:hypothetical protein